MEESGLVVKLSRFLESFRILFILAFGDLAIFLKLTRPRMLREPQQIVEPLPAAVLVGPGAASVIRRVVEPMPPLVRRCVV